MLPTNFNSNQATLRDDDISYASLRGRRPKGRERGKTNGCGRIAVGLSNSFNLTNQDFYVRLVDEKYKENNSAIVLHTITTIEPNMTGTRAKTK